MDGSTIDDILFIKKLKKNELQKLSLQMVHTCGALRAKSAKSDIHDIDRTQKMGFILTANEKINKL